MIDPRFFQLLCCPCHGSLAERGSTLECTSCGVSHPVIGGIPRFTGMEDAGQSQVASGFGYKWTRGAQFGMSGVTAETMDRWTLDLYGWRDEAEFSAYLKPFRMMLDAGAGNGRDLARLARLNPDALVIGIDISAAIDVAAGHLTQFPNVFLVQGDICQPPFKTAIFDYIASMGVLHHTPSTRGAVEGLYPLLREGGELAFSIYRKKSPIREFTDDYVRREIRKLSPAAAWKEMESITLLGKALSAIKDEVEIPPVPVLGIEGGRHNLQRLLYYTVLKCYWRDEWSFEDNVHVNYDWYYPEYAWRHTPEEVRGWIAKLGAQETFFKEIPAQLSFRLRRNYAP